MESSLVQSDMVVSGNLFSPNTYLFSDVFRLFPGAFHQLSSYLENDNRIAFYSPSGFVAENEKRRLLHTDISGYADDLINCLEKKQIDNITYMAHSVNGFLAFIAAVKAPHLFNRIVLTSAFASLQADAETQHLCGLQASDAKKLFSFLMQKEKSAGQHCHQANQGVIQLTNILCSAFGSMEYDEAEALFTLILSADCRSILADLSVPVMILQVASDRVSTNEAGYFMYRTIPDSQLVRIRAKGHLPQVDAPEEIVQAIKFFVHAPA